jgi:hypothetical protein
MIKRKQRLIDFELAQQQSNQSAVASIIQNAAPVSIQQAASHLTEQASDQAPPQESDQAVSEKAAPFINQNVAPILSQNVVLTLSQNMALNLIQNAASISQNAALIAGLFKKKVFQSISQHLIVCLVTIISTLSVKEID